MGLFGRKPAEGRLADAGLAAQEGGEERRPKRISVVTTIVTPNRVVSPLSGLRAAMIVVEVLERVATQQGNEPDDSDDFWPLGTVNLGDLLTLRDQDGDQITVVVPRVRVDPQRPRRGGTPLTRAPAELVPFLSRATGRGLVCYRELTLGEGDKVRLEALVEPSSGVVSSGYRSGSTLAYVARDDLGSVVIEEMLETPPSC